MGYLVMHRGRVKARTDDITEARAKLEELGDTSYIQYGRKAIEEYSTTHESLKGEQE